MNVDPLTIGTAVLALLYGIDKALPMLERLGKLPRRLRKSVQDYGKDLYTQEMAAETRERLMETLAPIAERQTEILGLLKPNGGLSVKDAVTRVEQRLEGIDQSMLSLEAKSDATADELYSLKRTVEAHITIHLDGPAS